MYEQEQERNPIFLVFDLHPCPNSMAKQRDIQVSKWREAQELALSWCTEHEHESVKLFIVIEQHILHIGVFSVGLRAYHP